MGSDNGGNVGVGDDGSGGGSFAVGGCNFDGVRGSGDGGIFSGDCGGGVGNRCSW